MNKNGKMVFDTGVKKLLKKATNIELKKINRNNIYRTLIENKVLSKQEIAYRLQISVPTVTQNVNELMEEGLVEETGEFASTGGRKPKMISSIPGARVALGLDITKNHVNLLAVDLETNVLDSVRRRIPFEDKKEYYQLLADMIDRMAEKLQTVPEHILGIGISVPAIVGGEDNFEIQSSLLTAVSSLYRELSAYLKYSCHFINDANAGGFAELYLKKIRRTTLYLSLSNSVGGAVITDGKINPGYHNRSGEFGHMTLIPGGRKCYCGQNGCVDTYCSALILANETDGNLKEFFAQLEKGNERIKAVWDEYLDYLAIVVNNLNVCYDCDIILGGYVGEYMEPYIEDIRNRVKSRCMFQTDATYLHSSRLKAEAAAFGAALYYISEFINKV